MRQVPGTRIAELGPGTGIVTREIAASLSPVARALAIDLDPVFVARLQDAVPQVECVCGSAASLAVLADARGLLPLDHVVSGLPFASLPVSATDLILRAIVATLRPGGTFTTFQYIHAYGFPAAVAFRGRMTRLMEADPAVSTVIANLPPAFVLTWRRAGEPVKVG